MATTKIASPQDLQAALTEIIARTNNPRRKPSRRILVGMLRQLADRVEQGDQVKIASMGEGEFWKIIEPFGWGTRTTDYKKIEKALMRQLTPDQAEGVREVFGKLQDKLYRTLDKEVEGLGDDSFGDLLAHIIGMGKREYYAVLKDPQLGAARARGRGKDGFTESFAYALPSKRDYERLNVDKYLKWAGKIHKATEVILGASVDDDLMEMVLKKLNAPLRYLNKVFGQFLRDKDAYALMPHEDQIKKAAEDIDKALSRVRYDGSDETLQQALWEVDTKWSAWNLLSDIRQYLMD